MICTHLYACKQQMIIILSEQFEFQVTILNTNNLHTVICFQVSDNNNNP